MEYEIHYKNDLTSADGPAPWFRLNEVWNGEPTGHPVYLYVEKIADGLYIGCAVITDGGFPDAAAHWSIHPEWNADALREFLREERVIDLIVKAVDGDEGADAELAEWLMLAAEDGNRDMIDFGSDYIGGYTNEAEIWPEEMSLEEAVAMHRANAIESGVKVLGLRDALERWGEWRDEGFPEDDAP